MRHLKNRLGCPPLKTKQLGIAVKLTGITAGLICILGITAAILSSVSLRTTIKEREQESLRNTAYALKNAYYVMYQGDFTTLQTYVGDTESLDAVSSATEVDVVSSATVVEAVDAVSLMETFYEETGLDVTVFWGDTVVLTSVKDGDGQYVSEGQMTEEIKGVVIDKGQEYFGENIVLGGKRYYVYYIPLNNNGTVVGSISAVTDMAILHATTTAKITNLILVESLVTIIMLVIVFLYLKRIAQSIKNVVSSLSVLISGDLTVLVNEYDLQRTDEIGHLTNYTLQLRDTFKGIVAQISGLSSDILRSADILDTSTDTTQTTVFEVSQAMEEISKGAMVQAEETQEASHSIIEIGNQISHITDSINKLKVMSDEIDKANQETSYIVEILEDSANQSSTSVEVIAEQTAATNTAAENIKEALLVITTIANQTNLLGLNASIEAARAGEHGKGFGVVAAEIQALANQSRQATKKIADYLEKLLSESEKSLQLVEDMKTTVGDQKDKLDNTKQQFTVVSQSIGEIHTTIESIHDKVVLLDVSRKEIVHVIESLSAISEENAASLEETTASTDLINETIRTVADNAHELRDKADSLNKSIGSFILD